MKLLNLFRTPSIRRRISFAFLIVTVFVVVLSTASYFQLRQVRPFSNFIVQDSTDLVVIQRLSSATAALDADLERYLVIRGAEYKDNVQNDLQEMKDVLTLLQKDPIEGTETILSDLETTLVALQEKVTPILDTNSSSLSSAEVNRLIVTVYNDIDLVKQLQAELSTKTLAALQSTAETQGSIADNVLTQSVILGIVVSLIAVVTTLLTDRRLRAITTLTDTAVAISGGDISRVAPVESNDEIGTLAASFNAMTSQLRDLIGSLEQRVADRTKALTSVAEISTAASTILDTDKLLQQVVDLAKERFNFYHSHIYLMNEAGDTLVLASGAGKPGQQMVAEGRSIPLDREQSLVARAAREKKGVTVNDVTLAPDFLPNPLLPDTRSELAVPMMVGDRVIGVFDVQSEAVGRFTDADVAVQTTLASQVASAIQNARSYTEVQHSQALLSDALKAARLGNWEYDFEKDLFHFTDEFYAIFRTSAERVGGYKISSADYAKHFVHPDDAPLVGTEIQKVLDAKDRRFTTNLEHRIIFPDGETGYIAVNINVERDENGKITRWYGANQDITERRRLEELNRKRAQQQEAINLITQKIQATTTIEGALQIAARELGRALGTQTGVQLVQPGQRMENK